MLRVGGTAPVAEGENLTAVVDTGCNRPSDMHDILDTTLRFAQQHCTRL